MDLTLEFVSERELYLSYMPFLKNGGVFIRTDKQYELGEQVMLNVTLPDSLVSSEVKASICWQTPVNAQNGTPVGIGVSFEEDTDNIHLQIEKILGTLLYNKDPTFTM